MSLLHNFILLRPFYVKLYCNHRLNSRVTAKNASCEITVTLNCDLCTKFEDILNMYCHWPRLLLAQRHKIITIIKNKKTFFPS